MEIQISERSEFGELLNKLKLTGVAVELGVFKGDFASQLLQQWTGKKLFLIDPWKHLDDYLDSWNLSNSKMEQNYQTALVRLSTYMHRIQVLRMRSEEATEHVEDNSCDFIYIDANHSYNHTKRDINLWYPKLKTGGILAGHDYYDALADDELEPILGRHSHHLQKSELTSYGVKSAVDEFVRSKHLKLYITSEQYPSWYLMK